MEKDIRLIRESRVYGFAFDELAAHALDSRQSLYYIKVPLTIRRFGWFLRTIIDTNMAFNQKYFFSEKEKIIIEYLNHTHGFRESCHIYGMSQGALKGWIRLYNAFGFEGLRTGGKTSHIHLN